VFRRVIEVSAAVSGVAVAIQGAMMAAGALIPGWWETVFPYLVGIPAGMAAVAKFTREDAGDNNEEKLTKDSKKKQNG
jgi:hypothetical protein